MGANTRCFVKVGLIRTVYTEVSALHLDEARETVKGYPNVAVVIGATYEEDDYDGLEKVYIYE